ncbi:hypothetical protein [Ensifer soli]|uniref:hypothetical protein n=1 Tax=Ciceribacter sp. sgz301302 TaxID=3342379 RepID=UPI0035B7BADC
MQKKLSILAAAALFSSVALGGAVAQSTFEPGDGDYFNGTTAPEATEQVTPAPQTGEAIVLPKVDQNATGSIADDKTAPAAPGDGDYYEGANPEQK